MLEVGIISYSKIMFIDLNLFAQCEIYAIANVSNRELYFNGHRMWQKQFTPILSDEQIKCKRLLLKVVGVSLEEYDKPSCDLSINLL